LGLMAKASPPAGKADEYLNPLDKYPAQQQHRRKSRILPSVEDPAAAPLVGKILSEVSDVHRRPSEAAASSVAPSEAVSSVAPSEVPVPTGYNRGVRRNSQESFAERMHTTLVLDWDDTLFPTTWVREDCKLDWRFSLEEQLRPGQRLDAIKALLEKHLLRVTEFFSEAEVLCNIFIVTLARRPWVENSMMKFMPGLQSIMEKHALKVIYAQEVADPKEVNEYMQDGKKTPEEGQAFWTAVKGTAIAKELDAFHRRYDASWKNVISLGDSDFERYGTVWAGQDYMKREMEGGSVLQTGQTAEGVSKDGHLKRLRVKTVKMLDKPTVLELTAELTLLRRWLPHVVRKDAGFDVEIDGTDDDGKLQELHKQMTNEDDPKLSWQDLAGMND